MSEIPKYLLNDPSLQFHMVGPNKKGKFRVLVDKLSLKSYLKGLIE